MKQYANLVLAIPHAVGEPLDFDWRKMPDVAVSAQRQPNER